MNYKEYTKELGRTLMSLSILHEQQCIISILDTFESSMTTKNSNTPSTRSNMSINYYNLNNMKTKILFIVITELFVVNVCAQFKKDFQFEDGTKATIVSDDNQYGGIVDDNGKIIVPKEYEYVQIYGNLIYCRNKKGQTKKTCELYNSKGECKLSGQDGVASLDIVKDNRGKFIVSYSNTVLDENGNKIYHYKELEDAQGFKYLKNTITDTIVIGPGKYRGLVCFMLMGDVIIAKNGNKKGVLNLDGSEVIPAIKYADILPQSVLDHEIKGYLVYTSSFHSGYLGYYDKSGKCIIPPARYSNIYHPNNGLFCCIENGKACIVDSLGKVLFKTQYSSLSLTKDEKGSLCYQSYLGNGKGLVSLDGKVIREPKPTIRKVVRESDDFKYIEVIDVNGLWGVNNTKGENIIPCKYNRILHTTSYEKISGFMLEQNEFVGFANNEGKVLIPSTKYHRISSIRSEGDFFEVEYNGRKGLCDKEGKEIISPVYDDIQYKNDVIYAKIGDMEGILGKDGKIKIPFEYTSVRYDKKNDWYEVELFGKKGVCDQNGRIIIPPLYTRVVRTNMFTGPFKELYRVSDGKTTGYYTIEGKNIFPASLFKNVIISNVDMGLPFQKDWYIKAYNDSKESVCYYDFNGKLLYDTRQDKIFDEYFEKGGNEFDNRNYKKAIEFYQKAISIKQDGSAYFNIGAALYNINKYKEAIKNLEICIKIGDSKRIKDKAYDLIIDCEEALQKRRERRANIWMAILGTGLNVAATIMQTNNAIQTHNSTFNKTSNSRNFVRNTNMDYLLDPRIAINQVLQEEWNEYLRMTDGGKTMSYQEWQIIKGQAMMEAKKGSTSTSSSHSSNSSNSNTSNYSSSSSKNCNFCAGLGDCKTCGGRGYYYNPLNLSKAVLCPNCKNHNGICSHCNGTGRI